MESIESYLLRIYTDRSHEEYIESIPNQVMILKKHLIFTKQQMDIVSLDVWREIRDIPIICRTLISGGIQSESSHQEVLESFISKLGDEMRWPKEEILKCKEYLKQEGVKNVGDLGMLHSWGWEQLQLAPFLKQILREKVERSKTYLPIVAEYPKERIVIKTSLNETYEIDRFCPHKGADLTHV